jgi:glucose-1-phosphate thymidylyltransferase
MVHYRIQTLSNAGIEDILLVTEEKNAGDFLRLLGNGRDFGLRHPIYRALGTFSTRLLGFAIRRS